MNDTMTYPLNRSAPLTNIGDAPLLRLMDKIVGTCAATACHLVEVVGDEFYVRVSACPADRDNGARATLGDHPQPHQILAIRKILESNHPERGKDPKAIQGVGNEGAPDEAPDVLCIPLVCKNGSTMLLYVEKDDRSDGFSPATAAALELIALPLQWLLDGASNNANNAVAMSGGDREQLSASERHSDSTPSTFAAVAELVSREINDQVSAIVAHASAALQWLNQEPPKVEKARNSVRKIASSAFSAGGIISTYRSIADSSRAKPELTDLNLALARAVERLASDVRKTKTDIEYQLSADSVILAHASQIEQALVSLIATALDAMNSMPMPRKLLISSQLLDDNLVVTVSDNGKSIPAEARDSVFDPTFSLREGRQGIRLAVAKSIAQLHGGDLKIAHSQGDGTRMAFTIKSHRFR